MLLTLTTATILSFTATWAPLPSASRANVLASALIDAPVLQFAPPAPPPPAGGGGGGGGDDEGTGEFLRLLSPAEQTQVLGDWMQRSSIYKLTNDAVLAAAHSNMLGDLAVLKDFVRTPP